VPAGRVRVVMVKAGLITMDKSLVAMRWGLWLSVTRTVKVNGEPVVVMGVPAITPVSGLMSRPIGRKPAEILQWYAPTPPVAATAWL